jgi:hypothetical protein
MIHVFTARQNSPSIREMVLSDMTVQGEKELFSILPVANGRCGVMVSRVY